ncbi:helix-turn-helix domain-containing protein [Peptoniphilus grossensis]|uniref:helix-turn-helix domain-containing protein n=1 Tax=Peptoniphilus grossensis TaxID=1465756 RepID=UPI0003003F6A|nr:helix-turn-helix transcriptional regulator [Peptoniphilus grossensis]
MTPLNKRLKDLIIKSGKPQTKVAREAGVHVNTLRNILNGKQTKNISLRVALGVAKATGAMVEELVKNTEYEIKS